MRCAGPIPGAPLHTYAILSCEATERLCYYGVRAVLVLFLLSLGFSEAQAIALNSYWIALCYLSPLLGAVLSDGLLGRYTTILAFTLLYVAGMALLAVGAQAASGGLAAGGLALVALAAGGIKPCVGPFGADQLPEAQRTGASYWLLFYVCINLGSLASYALVPLLRARYGFGGALALPAASMALSALIFVAPSARYTRVAPAGSALVGVARALAAAARGRGRPAVVDAEGAAASESEASPLVRSAAAASTPAAAPTPTALPPDSWLARARGAPGVTEADLAAAAALQRLLPFFALLPFFWAVYDSHASITLLQARRMGLCLGARGGSACLTPDQVAVLNPLLVVALVPLIDALVLPPLLALPRAHWAHPTPLRRMSLGMFLATLSFALTAGVQQAIDGGAALHVAVQLPQYVALALAEIGVSATGLEFFFGEAPREAKSVVLALFFLTTFAGDLLNGVLYSAAGGLGVGALVWVVTGLCAAASVAFALLAARYSSASK